MRRRGGAVLLGVAVGMLGTASRAEAGDLVLSLDLSNPRIYELVEPLRKRCIETALAEGRSRAEAIEAVPICLQRMLLSAVELERVLRTFYPESITPAELTACVRGGTAEDSLLACAQTAAREATETRTGVELGPEAAEP